MTASVEDAETLKAIAAVWDATAPLKAKIPSDRRLSGELPTGAEPYAQLACTISRPPEKFAPVVSGSKFLDFRKVTIKIWQIGQQACADILKLVVAAFPEYLVLALDGGTCKRVKSLGNTVEKDKQKAGDDRWKGTLTLEVWSERAEP